MTHDAVTQSDWRRLLQPNRISNVIPVFALLLFGVLFLRHISALDGRLVWDHLSGFSIWQWMAALAFTALSFRAIGTYDVLVHRVMRSTQPVGAARSAGIKAIALSQTLGFGALTGALVRWHCLPGLGAGQALRLSVMVSLSFLAALCVVTALVVSASGLGAMTLGMGRLAPPAVALLASAALILLARLARRLAWYSQPVGMATLAALLLACALDTACAAAALWVFWPEAIRFDVLFAAYLLALSAGLLSNAPGGVGAFDLTLLMLMPVTDEASALAALLAFRLIYYGLPATLALACLLRPASATTTPRRTMPTHREAALATQNARIVNHPVVPLLCLPSWGAGAVLGDLPVDIPCSDLTQGLPRALYKCSARQAAKARRAGWQALRIAQEAELDLARWSIDRPACRQLRRAVRRFEQSGLRIAEVTSPAILRPVAEDWARVHGRERGLSMGRFCTDYLRLQRVFAAYDGLRPVAFVSFHTGEVWTLDLMRHGADLPAGTMQALVCAGIDAARHAGASHLSLAAVPDPAANLPFADRVRTSAAGLRRFKTAFGPSWQPRYLCARSRSELALTAATLAYRIHNPPDLPPAPLGDVAIHPDDEDYSFAPAAAPCEAQANASGAHPHDKCPDRPLDHPRLAARRWRDGHDPVQHGPAIRRRA